MHMDLSRSTKILVRAQGLLTIKDKRCEQSQHPEREHKRANDNMGQASARLLRGREAPLEADSGLVHVSLPLCGYRASELISGQAEMTLGAGLQGSP
ncbi:hypothetical protein E1301_Tti010599 [Triplophysa tibetana]|uniref:Uncharacterized protein n=1 Tax=Triplophysa tibetana TaxID=1572043 RepID=A0A5A9PTA5_9TELE|nr:hypothetical protein E1301_Tti010599 [Triplophysa tibetana]